MIGEIVIPARLASTRLPEKLLLSETGKTIVEHTYRSCQKARLLDRITVAVDHVRTLQAVRAFGGRAQMTDVNSQSGTDRVAEVAQGRPDVDVFVNVQGDEPEIAGESIDAVFQLLQADPLAEIATLATPIRRREDLEDSSCVKVVCRHDGTAMYFSRSVMPFARAWVDSALAANPPVFLQHLGIYAYRRSFLLKISEFPASPLEDLEKLEQLRFLQAGCRIQVGVVAKSQRGIDTRADYENFKARCLQKSGLKKSA